MNEQLKTEALKMRAKIEQAERVLLSCHPSPDEDSVGSVLSVATWLRGKGKSVTIIGGDSKVQSWVRLLPGGETILNQTWLDTDLSQFDLYLALDIGSPSQITKLGEVVFPDSLSVGVIDHHARGEDFGNFRLVDGRYAATAELLYELFNFWNVEIAHDMAINLFVGVYGDTGGFQYSLTSERTFTLAADLARRAPDFTVFLNAVRNNNDPEWVAFNALGVTLAEVFSGGKIRLSLVSAQAWQEQGIKPENIQNNQIANTLRSISGCEIAGSLIEIGGVIRVSLRSRDGEVYDVGRIASVLGGGGHKAAAATTINKTLVEARDDLLRTIKDLYPALVL
jgi:phosphoesterase RecJ-like protein